MLLEVSEESPWRGGLLPGMRHVGTLQRMVTFHILIMVTVPWV